MHDALPHVSFIGFTGTPIELADANTRAVFGDYISVYDIQRPCRTAPRCPSTTRAGWSSGHSTRRSGRRSTRIQVAKLFGARIIAADVSDEKLALARQWGADETINVRTVADVAQEARRLTGGRGVDAAVDYVGHGQTFQAAIASLATAGRAVIIGVGKGNISIKPTDLVQTEKIITGSRHSTRTELIETMEIMARGLVTPVVGMRVPFAEVETIFDAIRSETLLGRGALTYG